MRITEASAQKAAVFPTKPPPLMSGTADGAALIAVPKKLAPGTAGAFTPAYGVNHAHGRRKDAPMAGTDNALSPIPVHQPAPAGTANAINPSFAVKKGAVPGTPRTQFGKSGLK